MENWYEVGKLYVWQNQVGEAAYLNGIETVVTGDIADVYFQGVFIGRGQPTSSQIHGDTYNYWHAERGDLRPKDPPSGQRMITDLFKLPQLEPA